MFERRKQEVELHRRPDTLGDVQPVALCDDDQSGGTADTQASTHVYTNLRIK